MPNSRPGDVAEFAVDFAVAAGEQEQQHVVRQILHLMLQRVPHLDVGQPIVLDQGDRAKRDATGGNDRPAAEIAVGVVVLTDGRVRRDGQDFELANGRRSLGMDVPDEHDRRGLGKIKGRFKPGANDHDGTPSFRRL